MGQTSRSHHDQDSHKVHERNDEAEVQGADAQSPAQIPGRGWKQILKRVKEEIGKDHVSLSSASIAYYSLLAIFPALLAIVFIAGFIFDPQAIEQQFDQVGQLLPASAIDVIRPQLREIVTTSSTGLGWGIALSVLAALWSASKGMKAVIEALNIAYDEKEQRGFIRLQLAAVGLTLAAIVYFVITIGLIGGIPIVLNWLQLGSATELLLIVGRWVFLAVMAVAGFSFVNRFAPCRSKPQWRWVSVGSVVATVLWLLGSAAFSYYVSSFGNFNETYGSIGGVIVLLLWLNLSAFTLLLGAEINSEMELQTRQDSTEPPDQPLGKRGAVKADHRPQTSS